MKNGNWDIFVQSELFSAGRHPEDSSPLEGISFSVVAEGLDGARYAHNTSFEHAPCTTCIGISIASEGEESGDCGAIHLSRREAEEKTSNLAERVAAAKNWAGPVNNPHWTRIASCYGSEAYIRRGEEAEAALLERREAQYE